MKSALNRCRDIWIRRYPFEQFFVVHKRYVKRLLRKLRFEEKRNSNQRRVLSDSETVRWLNHTVEKIWPVCMEHIVSQKILLPVMPWFLQQYKPWTAHSWAMCSNYEISTKKHEAELAAAASQPLPDDDDDAFD
ncbi:unnamed protein product [Camellia sinensis]